MGQVSELVNMLHRVELGRTWQLTSQQYGKIWAALEIYYLYIHQMNERHYQKTFIPIKKKKHVILSFLYGMSNYNFAKLEKQIHINGYYTRYHITWACRW
jgi:hypothetical protein